MPSHTAASALISLFFANGAPWNWPSWQEITGVSNGLFPDDDRLLPGAWTRQDAHDIQSYFRQYQSLENEQSRIKFTANTKGSASIPGRKKWTDFISKIWEKAPIHNLIVEGLRKHGVHPITLVARGDSFDMWPKADTYIPLALDTIGMLLFGQEAFGDNEILPYTTRKYLTVLVQRSWNRIREQIHRDKGNLVKLEQTTTKAFEGMSFISAAIS